jgi:hypothetical protein
MNENYNVCSEKIESVRKWITDYLGDEEAVVLISEGQCEKDTKETNVMILYPHQEAVTGKSVGFFKIKKHIMDIEEIDIPCLFNGKLCREMKPWKLKIVSHDEHKFVLKQSV